ncbi:MAG: GNAT family N-acetyltransferase [Microthrixaceae bacterium]
MKDGFIAAAPKPPESAGTGATNADPPGAEVEALADRVSSLLGVGPARWTPEQFAARTGADADTLLRMRRALGFADPPPGEAAFTEDDLQLVNLLGQALQAGIVTEERQLALNRVLGSALARVASAAVATFMEALSAEVDTPNGDITVADLDLHQLDEAMALSLPLMDQTLALVWRRHLAGAARRAVMATAGQSAQATVVGFADLVDFTQRTEQLTGVQLATAVARFEELAHDTVSALGGRVVKTIGDEVMFVAPSVTAAAAIAWRLMDLCEVDDDLTTLRAGIAAGPAVDLDGDIIGPAANLAHRLTSLAQPGTVVAPAELDPGETGNDSPAAAPPGLPHPGDTLGYLWQPMRSPREIRGIGPVRLASVEPTRHLPAPASPAEILVLSNMADRAFARVPTEPLGGWSLRLAGGGRRRANSVSTSAHPGLPLDDVLRTLRARYEALGRPPRLVITPISRPEGLDGTLAELGWSIEAPTVVMVGDLREIRHRCGRRAPHVYPLRSAVPSPEWLVGFDDLAGDTAAQDLEIMYGFTHGDGRGEPVRPINPAAANTARAVAPASDLSLQCFVAVTDQDPDGRSADGDGGNPAGPSPEATQAVGAGVVDGDWLGVFSMWTRTARRRRGLAAAVLGDLTAWATRHGCHLAYLQVEESNRAGRAAYARLGFEEAYRYHYRRGDDPTS